ncbi:Putative P-loop containing nucleoside triphosphate hydrolase [Septoria linicola]|uniref:P-loop containing nucleoside triphosphate hydrolase n=1 Tax=Septoria linicola TaxID=215465 RepID=A0A9Q9B986_9PEZI|nr:Putative P-loop containing nucleoside triphosphate hydrolase [Septoria linicola]
MSGRKRSRDLDDIDGDTELEIESASSSFRQSNANQKRTKVAMAQAMGGSAVSDDEDDYEEVLMADDDDQAEIEVNSDEYTLRQDSSDNEQEEDEIDEVKATQYMQRDLRQHKDNVPAESGVIEVVYMRNFMCHENLSIELGPLINFVIGHNGSGKSAVLTALQISLGNKASGTNRAKSLKDMIKHGSDSGMVGVKIKNKGENAYKPDLYGETLTVERHFTKSGSTTFKLKSTDNRIITTKKGDLDDVLDHFGLQMDNPINVLTQDLARQFLANSTPVEKYRFFIKGTQLETLDGDYNILEEHLDGIEAQLSTREEMIAELRQKEAAARDRVRRAERVKTLEQRYRHVARQHAWAQVEQQEEILRLYQENVVTAEQELMPLEQTAEDDSNRYETEDIALEAARRGVEAHQESLVPLQEAHNTASERWQANTDSLRKHVAEQRTIKDSIKAHKKNIARLETEITDERQRLVDAHGDAHEQRLRQLDGLKAEAKEAKEAYDEFRGGLAALDQEVKDAQKRLQQAEIPLTSAKADENTARAALNRVSADQGRKYAGYHNKMEELCKAIGRETRFRIKPVGPLGLHVQLLKPQWSSILEKTFGGNLDSFVVTSKQDQELLTSLAKRIGCSANAIIVNPTSFSVAGHEPEDDSDTILRVLKIDNALVTQALVITTACEQTVLVQDIEQGRQYMYNSGRRKNVIAVLTMAKKAGDGQRWEWTKTGGQKSSGILRWNGATRMRADQEQEIQARRADHNAAQRACEQADQNRKAANMALNQARQAVVQHKRESEKLKLRHQQADDAVEKLEQEIELNQPQDGKLQELERQLDEAKEELQTAMASMEDSATAKATLDDRAHELKAAVDETQAEVLRAQELLGRAQARVVKCEDDRKEALYAKNAALDEVKAHKKTIERLQGKVEHQEGVVEQWSTLASDTSARVRIDDGMTLQILDDLLEDLKGQFHRAQQQQGGSEVEIVTAHHAAQLALEEARKENKSMNQTANTIRSTLQERRRRWGLFRKYISMRTRIQFNYLLSERKFRGRVLLDHAGKELDIHVEPDMTKNSDSGRQAKTLSGGEKSFSTICLLLSIWEAMGSPIRCLDEFDVYMDSVNRAQSMGLMIQTARRSVGRQFILITPQSMSNVELGEDVHVHKMADPERRRAPPPDQRTLDFSRA